MRELMQWERRREVTRRMGDTMRDVVDMEREVPYARARKALTVEQSHDEMRWRWKERQEGGWDVWTREADGRWKVRFQVMRSKIMEAVVLTNDEYEGAPMWGLYAARDFRKGEKIGVYVGENIGVAGEDATLDEVRRRTDAGGGKHMMEVQPMEKGMKTCVIDGATGGYTGMQYANDARGMKGWRNNMEVGGTGTFTTVRRVQKGEELLFAYDKGGRGKYWKR